MWEPKRHDDRRSLEEWLRLASNLLIAVGLLTLLGWLWSALRTQGVFGDAFLFQGSGFTGRIDAFVQTLSLLVFGALAVGIGVALRRSVEQFEPENPFTDGWS